MASAVRYKNFLKLSRRWPLDSNKKLPNRDLGAYVRERIAIEFKDDEQTKIANVDRCNRIYSALNDLVQNRHRKDYPLELTHGSLGLDLAECQFETCDDEYSTVKQQQSFFGRRFIHYRQLFRRIRRSFSLSKLRKENEKLEKEREIDEKEVEKELSEHYQQQKRKI